MAAWCYEADVDRLRVTTRSILPWMFDTVAFKNDELTEHQAILRGRALRRTRTGWSWLFCGALFTFFASLFDLIEYVC